MNLISKKELKYSLGTVGLGALIYGIFKLYQIFIKKPPKPPKSNDETREEDNESISSQDETLEHIPYEYIIEDLNSFDLQSGELQHFKHIKQIQYRVILCLMKGNSYQGIVNLAFQLENITEKMFSLSFSGNGIKFVKVNGKRIQPREVKYTQHHILLPSTHFKQRSKNTIEIIFQNNYSFLSNGLSSYFLIDDNNKYSLRQQVIYSQSGWNQTPNIIPCISCTNQCTVHLQIIHPENFQAFSNATKELERNCTIAQYPKYPFLFDHTSFSHKSSAKSQSFLKKSSDTFSSYSSTTYYGRKRANTHFHSTKLPSIQQLFVFCSQMFELIPNGCSNILQNDVLIRYFCKYSQSHHFIRSVSQMHNYVNEVFRRLSSDKITHKIYKLDVFIINDQQMQGYFAPGALILSEQAVKNLETDSKCFYLIARGILAIMRMAQGHNILKISQILALNYSVFCRFQELRSYIYLMNLQYKKIRQVIKNRGLSEYFVKNEGHFLQYYSKELRYIIKQEINSKISFELNNVLSALKSQAPEQYWENLLSNYNFFSQIIIDPLVAYGLKTIGPPLDTKLLDQLKICFNSSKYALSFYTDKEISENLPKFIECQSYGLEDRMPKLRVLQKFKDFITQRYHNYLPVKSNTTEAGIFYNQFKKFNEKKNFHHYSTLKNQIRRVNAFGKDFIIPQRVPLICSLPAWKLFKGIKMYPSDPTIYKLLQTFDNIQDL